MSEATEVHVLSSNAAQENLRLNMMSGKQRAQEYKNLPLLPVGQEIKIIRIGSQYNIEYKHFRELDENEYPPCVDPKLDYEDKDTVNPITIITEGQTYKIPAKLWFPLHDVVKTICVRQMELRRKLLPATIFIDDKDQWVCKLFNLGLVE